VAITEHTPRGLEPWSSRDDARSFLQERLAYFGKVYASIGISFYLVGNLAAAGLSSFQRRLTDLDTWIVPVACLIYFVQWLLCRRGARSRITLGLIDGATTTLAALFHSLLIFTHVPAELPGASATRAMLLFSFGLLGRAIVVPSSARRTLTLGVLAVAQSVAATLAWAVSQPPGQLPVGLQAMLAAMWSFGPVVISTLASHVIFGLRREVREARRLGPYTLHEKIGEGGMGAVYRASHAMLRRPTAIKLLAAGSAGADRVRRFEREVQLTSQLTHPNTVAIFDYGRTPDGVFYYAMEYLPGVNLEDLVRLDGPQPAARVVWILRQVAASLTEAHGIGLVHRDIKPSNVILVAERGGAADVAKVVDFGLVREIEDDSRLTLEGRVEGTPHYLSPETISSPSTVSPRSDLYSLGCVGYYLVTGQRVFDGRSVIDVCNQHLNATPVSPSERLGRAVPDALSAIVMALLEKDIERRPASAPVVVEMLEAIEETERWTTQKARAWWNLRGPVVMAKSRRQFTEPVSIHLGATPTTAVAAER
jgi:eukaryotic-like serine/threonine-protein kinase